MTDYKETGSLTKSKKESNIMKIFTFSMICLSSIFAQAQDLPPAVEANIELEKVKWDANHGDPQAQYNIAEYYHKQESYESAVKWYTKSANQGNNKAKIRLANLYRKGRGVDEVDVFKAYDLLTQASKEFPDAKYDLRWLKIKSEEYQIYKAAKNGDMKALVQLGKLYHKRRTFKNAFRCFIKAATTGNAEAQYQMGIIVQDGNVISGAINSASVPRTKKAQEWFMDAAKNGHTIAQCLLGIHYYKRKNYPEALKWFHKSAKQKYSRAINNLGLMHHEGKGVEKNLFTAFKYYSEAAAKGYIPARDNVRLLYVYVSQDDYDNYIKLCAAVKNGEADALYKLAMMYRHGKNLKPNAFTTYNLLSKSAEQGHIKAKKELAYFSITDDDYANYMKLIKPVQKGDIDAQIKLAKLYGKVKIYYMRNYWLTSAAKQGNIKAYLELGKIEARARHFRDALKWYKIAADKGNSEAMYQAGKVTLLVNRSDYDKALEYFQRAADTNYFKAFSEVGRIYFYFKDEREKGYKILKKAATAGDEWSQYYLGLIHNREHDYIDAEKAEKFLMQAAEQGNPKIQEFVGDLCRGGSSRDALKRNDFEAYRWYQEAGVTSSKQNFNVNQEEYNSYIKICTAAKKGDIKAQCELGIMFVKSKYISRNDDKALALLSHSAAQGNVDAIRTIGQIYFDKHEYSQALEWFLKSAKAKDSYSTAYLGVICHYALGYEKDHLRALKLYQLAAKLGDKDAVYFLNVEEDHSLPDYLDRNARRKLRPGKSQVKIPADIQHKIDSLLNKNLSTTK